MAAVVATTVYPFELLPEGGTGLCLFAAAFFGANDAAHMRDAGMRVTCVDYDGPLLERMEALYPDDWAFEVRDAFKWAKHVSTINKFTPDAVTFDVVSVDNFTGDIESRVLDSLPLWCSLARELVTVTLGNDATYEVPDGWKAETMRRSPLASWLVLTRA